MKIVATPLEQISQNSSDTPKLSCNSVFVEDEVKGNIDDFFTICQTIILPWMLNSGNMYG